MTRETNYSRGGGRRKSMGAATGRQITEGGYYHDTPRVAAADRVEQMQAGRRCACGKRLTSFNRAEFCYACQRAARA